jgi:hypothetical protein
MKSEYCTYYAHMYISKPEYISKSELIGHDKQNPASKVLRNLVLQTCYVEFLERSNSQSYTLYKRVREQASSESADEISGEVTACSHCLQPGFFRVSQLVDSRVLNPSYIDEDSFLKPMVVSHSVESLQERALVINRRQPNCNC